MVALKEEGKLVAEADVPDVELILENVHYVEEMKRVSERDVGETATASDQRLRKSARRTARAELAAVVVKVVVSVRG